MRRTHMLIAAVAVVAAAGIAIALTSSDSEDEGPFVISPPSWDFGRLMKGKVRTKTFTIKNNTGEDVVLRDFKPSCSCIRMEKMPRPMLPRDSEVQITMYLETGRVPAQKLRKHLAIYNSYGPFPIITIPIQADTYLPYKVNVTDLHFGKIDGSESNFAPRVISVRPEPGFVATPNETQTHKQGLSSFTHAKFFDVEIKKKDSGYDIVLTLRRDARGSRSRPKLDAFLVLKIKWGELTGKKTVKNEDWRFDDHPVSLHGTWVGKMAK